MADIDEVFDAPEPKRGPGRPRKDAPETEMAIEPAATRAAIEANKPKMVSMLLERNYRPIGDESTYEIVGHWTKPVVVKNAAGKFIEIEPTKFVPNEMAPAPQAGISPESPKIWAGSIVKFTRDEAMMLRNKGLASVEIDN